MDVLKVAAALEAEREYEKARALLAPELEQEREPERALKLRELLVRCTYKDPDLPLVRRFDDALRLLTETVGGDADMLPTQESFSLAGAIYKRKWEVDGYESNLRRALALYRRAANDVKGVEGDDGYSAINVAFVLDVLADLERREDPSSSYADEREAEARDWRNRAVAFLRPKLERSQEPEWWQLVTLAEALIGLGDPVEAKPWVQKAAVLRANPDPKKGPKPWQIESTARQIAAVVRLGQGPADIEAFRTSEEGKRVRELLGDEWTAGVESAWTGKIGLALSGGGFRAALFHIGVLARLAELDVLRRLEVLSCVSGGSIVGAYYYLEVCRLLKEKPDKLLDREDYLKLVQEIEKHFLDAIGSNIRMRLLTNPFRVLQMAVARGYTRTERAGQLYQKQIYSQLGNADWRLPDLLVKPEGEDKTFKPKYDNWRRSNKVPILVINATTMNTGHNWQFTGSWMGEPPSAIDDDVDSADRLRRMYHEDDAPERYRKTPLRRAVAASAAVPGLFPPISLRKLYPDVTVRLSDGGVHDNQGVASLIDQECSVMLVSDASGQGESITPVGDRSLPTLMRTMSVAMARIRNAQYLDLAARRAVSSLRGLMFVHLKQDLPRAEITWEGGTDRPGQKAPAQRDAGCTPYGVRRDVQRSLASIRTDLDAFHEYEAYGLMASGYRMVEHYFPTRTSGFATDVERHEWRFCSLQSAVEGGDHHGDMLDALARSNERFFKWFPWPGAMKAFLIALALVLLVGAGVAVQVIGGWSALAIALGVALGAGLLCALPDDNPLVYALTLVAKVPLGIVAMVLAPLLAWPYLWTLNRLYLAEGRAVSNPRKWDAA